MVGAGGIGCELLKNLVLMGFGEIHVVDLDTIDISNLNRQFLFRREHIKQSKAHVAKESASRFNPHVRIESYHANVKDARFDKKWFKTFDIVFNALDNLDARKYVNQMCISMDVPLVESGTTGFNGQAAVIKKGVTECFACYEKETPKSFPVCTIRSTPSLPIHCIVWAKSYLFTEVFGAGEDNAAEMDFNVTGENAEEVAKLMEETSALKRIRDLMGTPEFPRELFSKVFVQDIERLRSMETMWDGKRPPEPLSPDECANGLDETIDQLLQDQRAVWTRAQCLDVYRDATRRLTERMQSLKSSGAKQAEIEFDKDDEDTLDFVVATANLRSYIFGIEPKSKFDVKQMAGNIIPAIATTNAIIAGACVLQAFKIFRGDYSRGAMFAIGKTDARLMNSYQLEPNPLCSVCSAAYSDVRLDLAEATMQDLVDGVLRLAYKSFSIFSPDGLIFERDDAEDDEDMEDVLSNKLSNMGITAGTVLRISDDDKLKVDLALTVEDYSGPLMIQPVKIPDKPTPKPAPGASEQNGTKAVNGAHTNGVVANGVTRKRAASDDLRGPPSSKQKVDKNNPIVIDDEDGAIVLD
jgi:ubiquitin-like 1-activating enzyme E1 B